MKPETERTWRIQYIIPDRSTPTQSATIQAPNPQVAREIFAKVYKGCKMFSAPKRIA